MAMTGKINAIGVAGVIVSMTLTCMSCRRAPDYVVQPDKMAQVLADIHIAESVLDMNHANYPNDSTRKVVKQAILEKHGITAETLDTSFMWYGANLDKYMDVYEQTAEILQNRLDNNDAIAAAQAALSVSGDSVDVWSSSRRYVFSDRSSTQSITFNYNGDANWKSGDAYTWRAKLIGNPGNALWSFVTVYNDGATEVLNTRFSGQGWQEMRFMTDSTRTPTRIYGLMQIDAPEQTTVYIDSMQLIRKRLSPEMYSQRYRQKLYKF